MMLLACDTSSDICSVALVNNGEVLYTKQIAGPQIHIEKLSIFLHEALVEVKRQAAELDQLVIAIGPGSFNGLRIGLATMKALALTMNVPLIPVKTTDALAYGLWKKQAGVGRAVIFSHRDYVHFADYTFSPEITPATQQFHYSSWETLFESGVDFYFGRAERGFKDWLASTAGVQIRENFYEVEADAINVALYAAAIKSQKVPDLDELEPFYNAKYEAKKWVPPKF
ncbi:MAG: tRNA (adenosine(37)-N6)-threonylcarbamoyltransferase complex dimerization subunit type 1 TsaB [Candidatus Marinimicrobia bacterium]|nr:tRNA (adenosine(37)-N6)-threonylcarbamoyltransferase complex dimerization subunit type 1 TsaB [Candidatus Neomarinimicrobiota bacterium]MCF7905496.1 tRNA (adenosine(37)-N6)-threonylcarbamoyltransferase complex dimerization subunit type 1 TsaB [Candidatus Neomarinimicrobiota bacterium]